VLALLAAKLANTLPFLLRELEKFTKIPTKIKYF
jgi:hypothetical protein